MEQLLGIDYFAKTPPLLAYHGDRASLVALVTQVSPALALKMGVRRLTEATSMLAARCFLSGFTGVLADGPLIAFWEDLFENRNSICPRWPLISWLAGLIRSVEGPLIDIVAEVHEDEAVPLFFQRVQQAAAQLPEEWRPGIELSIAEMETLKITSQEASRAYAKNYNQRCQGEAHVRQVSESLNRADENLSNMIKIARDLNAQQS